jgi:hypothetical protein
MRVNIRATRHVGLDDMRDHRRTQHPRPLITCPNGNG